MRRTVPWLVFTSSLLMCGCKHYEYRLVQPSSFAQPIGKQTITVRYEPLEYGLVRSDDHVALRIANPTEDPITLLGPKSYVVDPAGETHPVPVRAIAPHSYIGMMLPPIPRVSSSDNGSGGLGFGFYDPFFDNARYNRPYIWPYNGFYDPFFYGPPAYYRVKTPYDWEWKAGEARLRLEYELGPGKNFIQELVIDKRRVE